MTVRVGDVFHVYLGESLETACRDWLCAYPGHEVEVFAGRIPGGSPACRYRFENGQYVSIGGYRP